MRPLPAEYRSTGVALRRREDLAASVAWLDRRDVASWAARATQVLSALLCPGALRPALVLDDLDEDRALAGYRAGPPPVVIIDPRAIAPSEMTQTTKLSFLRDATVQLIVHELVHHAESSEWTPPEGMLPELVDYVGPDARFGDEHGPGFLRRCAVLAKRLNIASPKSCEDASSWPNDWAPGTRTRILKMAEGAAR